MAETKNNPPVKAQKEISPLVQWGFRYHSVVMLVVCVLAVFGIFALDRMNKNEFPDFTIRQGILIAVYPGANALEMEDQVMKPMEDYIFSYKEVKKTKTRSNASHGMVMTQIELDDNVHNTDEFWSKFHMDLDNLKAKLPKGVLAIKLISNFGDTSSILMTMQSDDKTYRELDHYMDRLKDCLREVPSVGTMTVTGMQYEQIAVTVDPERLSRYAIDTKTVAAALFAQDFKTSGGDMRSLTYTSPIYVEKPLNSVREIEDIIILSLPSGPTVRLRDIADVKLQYPDPTSFITNNDTKCLLLSVEMKKGNNVVEMGRLVDKQMEKFEAELPGDISLFKVTDQPKVVDKSVWDFMRELLIAVIAVVVAIMLLLPLRVALIAASTIPITVFVSLSFFYIFGFELNTVTLACLIMCLGMIVDNSVVIIDSYVDFLAEGLDPKTATLRSASEFFKSIFSATLAISVTFFPFLFTVTGMFHDFLEDFPWAVTIILMGSFFIAELLVPYLQYAFIKPAKAAAMYNTNGQKKHFSILATLQGSYDKLIAVCFRHPWWVCVIALGVTVLGTWLLAQRPIQMMPHAERNQFAVEIFLPTDVPVEKTNIVADSLASVLRKDDRVVSVCNFHGCSSPRFQTTYAPQPGGPNFAQFIVNTVSDKATVEVLHDYTPLYEDAFPDAVVRFRQLSYTKTDYPIEVRVHGDNFNDIQQVADSIMGMMRRRTDVKLVRSSMGTPSMGTLVTPEPVQMSRLGLTTTNVELDLGLRYGKGITVGSLWDGDYDTDVVLKTNTSDWSNATQLLNGLMATGLTGHAPLRQFATVTPAPGFGQLTHLNGIRTVYVMACVPFEENVMAVTKRLQAELANYEMPEGVYITFGGDFENTSEVKPQVLGALMLAVVIIFFILLFHYKKIRVALMLLGFMIFSIPGAGFGLAIQGVALSLTCTLGIVSLMGILVRNVIIMIDYAEELQHTEGLSIKEAIFNSAKRRMRPIFLTSAAASMGVIPMIIGKSPLWMPMGTVIFYGTIITMLYILTIVPVLYWKLMPQTKATQE